MLLLIYYFNPQSIPHISNPYRKLLYSLFILFFLIINIIYFAPIVQTYIIDSNELYICCNSFERKKKNRRKMNQCVPSWDFDDNFVPPRVNFHANDHSNSTNHVPSLDYEVAELTWENGQLAMHGLAQPRVVNKPIPSHAPTKYATWEKPRAGGTLESIVNQATGHAQLPKFAVEGGDVYDNDLEPWIHHRRAVANHAGAARTDADASVTMTMDALVPCNNGNLRRSTHENQERHSMQLPLGPAVAGNGGGTCMVGSCSGAGIPRAGIRRSCRQDDDRSVSVSLSGSATCWGSDGSRQLTVDTWEREFGGGGGGFTSATSLASPEYTRTSDDRDDSVCHSISHQTCHEVCPL
ncbi:hypothetical protein ACP275_02G160800 [Erythranthe tilingii]